MTDEQWRPIPGFEWRYEVSNLGCVRNNKTGRLLKPFQVDGYRSVGLYLESGPRRRRLVRVHRMVALAWLGKPVNDDLVCAHLNGDRWDARVENLAWVTCLENSSHMNIHGTNPVGEDRWNAKLTPELVREIRRRTERPSEIAREFGISAMHVTRLRRRQSWAWLDD